MLDTQVISKANRDGFGHEIPNEGITNDWITPPWIIRAFNKINGGGRRNSIL